MRRINGVPVRNKGHEKRALHLKDQEKMGAVEKSLKTHGNREKVYGPRARFLEKYRVTGNFEESKQELSAQGFKYNDEVLEKWIEEDTGR